MATQQAASNTVHSSKRSSDLFYLDLFFLLWLVVAIVLIVAFMRKSPAPATGTPAPGTTNPPATPGEEETGGMSVVSIVLLVLGLVSFSGVAYYFLRQRIKNRQASEQAAVVSSTAKKQTWVKRILSGIRRRLRFRRKKGGKQPTESGVLDEENKPEEEKNKLVMENEELSDIWGEFLEKRKLSEEAKALVQEKMNGAEKAAAEQLMSMIRDTVTREAKAAKEKQIISNDKLRAYVMAFEQGVTPETLIGDHALDEEEAQILQDAAAFYEVEIGKIQKIVGTVTDKTKLLENYMKTRLPDPKDVERQYIEENLPKLKMPEDNKE